MPARNGKELLLNMKRNRRNTELSPRLSRLSLIDGQPTNLSNPNLLKMASTPPTSARKQIQGEEKKTSDAEKVPSSDEPAEAKEPIYIHSIQVSS
jgi:hypothetical protein